MIELLRNRRSIRRYTDEKIGKEKMDALEEAVLRAPTSRNLKPCMFYFVQNKDLLEKIALAKPHGAAFIASAPLATVICADENRSDVWIEDASIASILLQMTAQSLQLGSCWVQIRQRMHDQSKTSEQYIREILKLDKPIRIESVIAVGYPSEIREGVPKGELDLGKINKL